MYMARKHRTQLYLEASQKKILEEHSHAAGKSVGQLIREAVDEVYLRRHPVEKPLSKDDPIWKFIGSGRSKTKETDISVNHDKYLYLLEE